MPKNYHNDPGLLFPRLQARIQRMEGKCYSFQVWLWADASERQELISEQRAGDWRDAFERIQKLAEQHDVWLDTDDIDVI